MPSLDLPPAPDAPTDRPDSTLVSSWSATSMDNYLRQSRRWEAGRRSAHADKLIAYGAVHEEVMMTLGRAEEFAPDDERAAYIARTDAYAAHYGLRGWYRYTADRRAMDSDSRHRVQVNKLRTPADGNRHRYFYYTPMKYAYPKEYAVIDRDTGTVVFRDTDKATAQKWITTAEAAIDPTQVVIVDTPA
jgi:hypothetical protein